MTKIVSCPLQTHRLIQHSICLSEGSLVIFTECLLLHNMIAFFPNFNNCIFSKHRSTSEPRPHNWMCFMAVPSLWVLIIYFCQFRLSFKAVANGSQKILWLTTKLTFAFVPFLSQDSCGFAQVPLHFGMLAKGAAAIWGMAAHIERVKRDVTTRILVQMWYRSLLTSAGLK